MLLLFSFLLIFFHSTFAHPQCLDFKPPFKAERKLKFCPQYSDFGCCTGNNDFALESQFNYTRNRIPTVLWRKCGNYVKELFCQKCSPYAAHIYDAEQTFIVRPFPGLCPNYCREFYRSCREVVQYMTSDTETLRAVSLGQNAFCEHVNLSDIDYCYPDLLTNDVLNNRISQVTVNSEGCLCVEEFANKLKNPVFARHSGDGSQRLFVGEVTGTVHIYYLNGTKETEPFLDLGHQVLNTINNGDERGFLGMAFHPNFRNNQKFYIYYSTSIGGSVGNHKIRISQMTVSKTNRNKANLTSEKTILEIAQPYWNHNGGEILFGDDGYLYLFVGDGGAGGDPQNFAQNLSSLLGKILRLDVDVDFDSQRYKIPPDNPFIYRSNANPEIYAYGVRNIWRCGKDRGDPVTGEGKGRILCGDVGQNAHEEIDIVKKGVNYGWNAKEGNNCFDWDKCFNIDSEELPIHTYPHSVGKSITGGHFYRGCQNPNLNGYYFFGDFMNGKLFRLLQNRLTGDWESKQLFMCKPDMCVYPLQSNYEPHIISFGEDEDGEVYMLSTGYASSASPLGSVYKIVDPSRRGNPANCRSARHPTFERVDTDQGSNYSYQPPPPTYPITTAPSVKSYPSNRKSRQKGRYSLKINGIRMRLCKNRRRNYLCNTYKFIY